MQVSTTLNITTTGTAYQATFSVTGTGFAPNDTITVLGSEVGGVDGVNNVTITINTVDTGGEILTYTVTGTAVNSASYSNISGGTNLVGNGANFDITINGLTQNYTVAVASPGSNYAPNQTIEISGDTIGGQSPANDLTITIVDVDNDSTLTAGGILTVNASGTAPKATSGYTVEDRLSIIGSSFVNGVDGTNDLIIRITSVDGDGGITNYSTRGTAPDAVAIYNGVASPTGGGSNATFGVHGQEQFMHLALTMQV